MKQLIKKLLEIVRKALSNDPDDVAAMEKLKKQVADLSAEKAEIEGLTPEINEIIDLATASTTGGDPDPDPVEDGVTLGFISDGEEDFSVVVKNTGITAERKALLKSLYEGAVLAGESQPAGGAAFASTVHFDDGTGKLETKFDNAKQKAAFDVAVLTAFLNEAKAQLEVTE